MSEATPPAAGGPDPDRAEEFAEEVGLDPTPQEVEHYRQLEGDEPLGDAHPPGEEPTGSDAMVE